MSEVQQPEQQREEATAATNALDGGDDAPPARSSPLPSDDGHGDARRLVERLSAPAEPRGKKLFIGGISWQSNEGRRDVWGGVG